MYRSIGRSRADDLREHPKPGSPKMHAHFHFHDGTRHAHRHRHDRPGWEHAHSKKMVDPPGE